VASLVLRLAAEHPAARGHFPGNPIIPGAVLLSEALGAAAAALGIEIPRCTVSSAKFPSPSRPGDRVDIEYSMSGRRLSLACSVADRPVLKAEIACDAFVEVACAAKATPA
jgi:3-hydroxymyristoyl/3-hydroxydecanoyl-(acyl carrier protein) dehydratase